MSVKINIDSDDLDNFLDGLGEPIAPKLRRIVEAKSDREKRELISGIAGILAHAGTFFDVAAPAFPILVEEISLMEDGALRVDGLLALGPVLHAEKSDSVPAQFRQAFSQAKATYLQMLKNELGHGIKSKDDFIHALVALVSGYGLHDLADSIDCLGIEE